MTRLLRLQTRYHLRPCIENMRSAGMTETAIADTLGVARSTVKLAVEVLDDGVDNGWADALFGKAQDDQLAKVAEIECLSFFVIRGWQASLADQDCVYDVYAVKGSELLRVQVKTTSLTGTRGWPRFSLAKKCYNKTQSWRREYASDEFDYWYFRHTNGDCWMIPFEEVNAKVELSMEGYDQYFIGTRGCISAGAKYV